MHAFALVQSGGREAGWASSKLTAVLVYYRLVYAAVPSTTPSASSPTSSFRSVAEQMARWCAGDISSPTRPLCLHHPIGIEQKASEVKVKVNGLF